MFGLGALLGALAQSLLVLTSARCIQGAASAAAVPSALRLLTSAVTGESARAKALAAWSAAGAAAGASGLVVGGTVTALASWRYVFWALLVVAAMLAPAVLRTVPADLAGSSRQSLNVAGSALLTLSVMAVVSGATIVSEPGRMWLGAGLLVAAVLLALTFVYADRRSSAPLLPRSLVRQPTLRRGSVGAFINTATTSSVATLATLYVQDTLGESPLATAAMLLPLSLLVIAGSGLAARVLPRVRPETLTAAGLALIALGFALLVVAGDQLVCHLRVHGTRRCRPGPLGSRHDLHGHRRPGARPDHRLRDHQHHGTARHGHWRGSAAPRRSRHHRHAGTGRGRANGRVGRGRGVRRAGSTGVRPPRSDGAAAACDSSASASESDSVR